jgi:hypothetical protein
VSQQKIVSNVTSNIFCPHCLKFDYNIDLLSENYLKSLLITFGKLLHWRLLLTEWHVLTVYMKLYHSYLELAILLCWRFLPDRPIDSLQRLVMMTRGLGDPVASAYCRLYMAHCAQKLPSHDIGILVHIVCQFLGFIKHVNQMDPFNCENKICMYPEISWSGIAYIIFKMH